MAIYRGPGGIGESSIGKRVGGPNSTIENLTGLIGPVRTPTYIQFDKTANHSPIAGQLTWNEQEGTLDVGLNTGTVALQIGEEILYRVHNGSGVVIPDGTLVMFTGTLGNSGRLVVAAYDGVSPPETILGLATEEIGIGLEGYVTHFGKVRGIQTDGDNYGETWADGDIIYASPTGGLTNVRPEAPDTITIIAIVIHAHGSNGTLFVRFTPSSALDADDIMFLQSGTGAVARTVQDKLSDVVSVKDFGAVGDGVTDDTAAVMAAESAGIGPYDLLGGTYLTTISTDSITQQYFNGTLITQNIAGNQDIYRTNPPISNAEIRHTGRKSPVTLWAGKTVLWLGTSIPAYADNDDDYPTLCANRLGFNVVNKAFAGSSCRFPPLADFDPYGSITQVRRLSMTQADVDAGLALYGAGSVFDDDYDPVTKASDQTIEARCVNIFSDNNVSVVILDHNHNDRRTAFGTLDPQTYTITGVTLGTTTTFSMPSTSGIAVGDGLTVRVSGIAFLDYAFGRVISVTADSVTIGYDSTGFSGAFVSGTATLLDRNTICGAWDFVVSAIYNSAVRNSQELPVVILCGAPSEFTNDTPSVDIWSINRKLENYASARGLAFFDISESLAVRREDHLIYFPDGVHPSTPETRAVLAAHWVQWLSGGAVQTINPNDYLRSASSMVDQAIAVYSETLNGFVPMTRLAGPEVSVLSDDFADGDYTGWTAEGTAPVVEDAPWGVGKALKFIADNGAGLSQLRRSVALDVGSAIEFDFYLPVVTGLATGLPKTISLMQLRASGAYLGINLTVREGSVQLRPAYFKEPNTQFTPGPNVLPLEAERLYRIRLESFKTTAHGTGYYALSIDGERIFSEETDDILQGIVSSVRIGLDSTNLTGPVTAYIGNIDILDRAELLPASGDFTTADSKTVTVTNGIITGIA